MPSERDTTKEMQQSRLLGCLLGGAVGDALGAPIEFEGFQSIVNRFGPHGIRDFAPVYGHIGAITDDTQMTLFTAEGLLRAQIRWVKKGICHRPSVAHRAYLRWLHTQGETPTQLAVTIPIDGWLIGTTELWSRRAPGVTCLSALRNTREIGAPATNDSKGCGGVMRVAPVGLAVQPEVAFEMGSEVAALTHGHPSGYLSAAYLALLISNIVRGASLQEAILAAKAPLINQPKHEEVLAAICLAEREATSGSRDCIVEGRLGAGWVAEEALSIAIYSSLIAGDFEQAILLSVNHSGDSDSTGAITGNICGALYGVESIPSRWLEAVELRKQIAELAIDLLAMATGTLDEESQKTWERYPGY